MGGQGGLVWAPTGSGKTHVFGYVLAKLVGDNRRKMDMEKRRGGGSTRGIRAVVLTRTVPLA